MFGLGLQGGSLDLSILSVLLVFGWAWMFLRLGFARHYGVGYMVGVKISGIFGDGNYLVVRV